MRTAPLPKILRCCYLAPALRKYIGSTGRLAYPSLRPNPLHHSSSSTVEARRLLLAPFWLSCVRAPATVPTSCSRLSRHSVRPLVGYLRDYKGLTFRDPVRRKELVSYSAIFHESTFPSRKPGLSGLDCSVDPFPPAGDWFLRHFLAFLPLPSSLLP